VNKTKLITAAHKAKKNSYSPYSKFRVGAALLTSSGKIITGCNIENSSYSLTICAERTALFKAVSEGHKRFKAIVIASDSSSFIPPCGACRQVLSDLAGNIDVFLSNNKHEVLQLKMEDFLPMPFNDSMLKNK
jgi:cytidine deaminase